jgi:hypothetical protein
VLCEQRGRFGRWWVLLERCAKAFIERFRRRFRFSFCSVLGLLAVTLGYLVIY